MATVTVRHLDDEVRRLLRIRAATNDRSMEAEIRDILTRAVTRPAHEQAPAGAAPSRTMPATRHTTADQDLSALSPRERTVATLVAQGLTNREVAARLYLSERTVESHVSAVLTKLGLRSRSGIAARLTAAPPTTG